MEWYIALIVIFGGLLFIMTTGLPIAICFIVINIVAGFLLWGGTSGLEQLAVSMFGSVTKFTLVPVALFILMGEVMFHSGIAPAMIATLDKWMWRIPGRLSLLAVAAGTLLATLTGQGFTSVAILGSVLVPEMKKHGYKNEMSLGPIMGAGGLAPLIPPVAWLFFWQP